MNLKKYLFCNILQLKAIRSMKHVINKRKYFLQASYTRNTKLKCRVFFVFFFLME